MLAARVRLAAFTLLLVGAGFLGCQRGKNASQEPPPPEVSVIKPVIVPVQHFYEYNGHLETTQMVEVRARVKGVLTKVHFRDGVEVRGKRGGGFLTIPGDLLYTIDEREYRTNVKKAEAELGKAEADIENWTAQIALAKAELKRAERAAADSATAQTEVDKARATLGVNTAMHASAIANRDAAAAALHTAHIQLGYTQIHALIDGRISRTHVDEGNLVGQTDPTLLTTIVRMDELFVNFDVPENDWAKWGMLSNQSKQLIPIEVGTASEEGYPHKGHLDFSENRVDVGTGTVRIRGRIPNPILANGTRFLYPGLYARIRVAAGTPKPEPVIPEEAMMTGQEGRYVYVVGPDNKVMKRSIALGPQVYRAAPAIENKPAEWVMHHAKPPEASPGGLPPRPQTIPVKSVVAVERGLAADDVLIVEGLQKARPGGEVAPEMLEFRGPK